MRERESKPQARTAGFTGLRRALDSGLAFFALCALLVGVVWAVNAPTVKASDPPPGACSEVCTVNAACTQSCVGEVPMTCGE
ncbi:MAG TPA: hypothetical protein VJU18_08180, partial [Vicinamibacteria bacterium]|nr:hypothetical protein [Vicinamibacteria bacterium]